MRLLNTTKRKLEIFEGSDIPLYAILSHTWGKREITFQDIEGDDAEEKAEYEKVKNTCDIAAAHELDYVWIDTCCIDKTSSAELSEAINPMYSWYQNSVLCYAYLADVPTNVVDHKTGAIGPEFSESVWFTRGWTLQELIGPSVVIFLDQKWQEIGTKSSLQRTISRITGIPTKILLGGNPEDASIAQRMSWASRRKTTRVEDLAYCLMGMFGINMPLLYGEGERAFTRLQEEIIKVSDDHSLFAWRSLENRSDSGLLASSPAMFSKSDQIVPLDPYRTLSGAITVNNKGIHLKLYFKTTYGALGLAILPCLQNGKEIAIYLRAISGKQEYFARTMTSEFTLLDAHDPSRLEYDEKSICVQRERRTSKNLSGLHRATANGNEVVAKLLLEKGAELETKDSDGQTPLVWAARNGYEAAVKLLVEKGAKLETKDSIGQTPLSWAARNGCELVVKLLVEKGAELETKDCDGQTPLVWAAKSGREVVVKLLVEKGAKLETKDSKGQTPLSWAARNGCELVVKLLVEKGAKLETKDLIGQTPLSWAARNGYNAVVKLLVDKGAKLETKDSIGQTPLSWAAKNRHEVVVKLLVEEGAKKTQKI